MEFEEIENEIERGQKEFYCKVCSKIRIFAEVMDSKKDMICTTCHWKINGRELEKLTKKIEKSKEF